MSAASLLPARLDGGGTPCANRATHAPHDDCPGLRPADWVTTRCAGCKSVLWVPPTPPASTSEIPVVRVPVCSAKCALEVIGSIGRAS